MANDPIYPADALILAPLSGYTDLAYRAAAGECGCRFAFTEMVDAAALAYARKRTECMLERGPGEDFLGVQLVGSDPVLIARAMDVINEYDFDLVDFNLGCPVPKVTRKGAGAELGRHLDRALACFAVIAEKSRFPVTAKLRILSFDDPEPTLELAAGLAALGAKSLTVHGRVKEAYYSGPVAHPVIRAVREALPGICVVANGGVMRRANHAAIVEATGCSRVMLARGAMGNPWLFREIAEGDKFVPPSLEEFSGVVERHIRGMIKLYGESAALPKARKILHDYYHGRGFPGAVKAAISTLSTEAEFTEFLDFAQKSHAESYFDQVANSPDAARRIRRG
ncbi:MAG: tRNA-dihydrouridine synthase family protein [Victivallaceae bacterium]|nr:tRNA-dihydrouridine synthase family protein [Victivallaceae bacterium]